MTGDATLDTVVKWEPYRPSNGTEGDIFMSDWCWKCKKDKNGDCPIIAASMAYDIGDPGYPKEWRRRADSTEYPVAECTAFEAE